MEAGVWQIHVEREQNGQKMPDASERMKSMAPEEREKVEEMIRRNGVAPGTRRTVYHFVYHGMRILCPRCAKSFFG